MAIVKYGAGVIDMRGSIGGTTYSRNRAGAIARARTKPINPSTEFQQIVRNILQSVVNAWSEVLTAAQRTAWNDYATAVPWLNALGEAMLLTGYNMYCRSNIARIQAGLARVDDGPTTLLLPEGDAAFAITVSEATQLVSITFDDTALWVDEDDAAMIIKTGRPQNPSRNFYKSPWRYAGNILGDGITPETSPATVTSAFQVTEDQKVWAEARIVRADGRMSVPFRGSVLVAS